MLMVNLLKLKIKSAIGCPQSCAENSVAATNSVAAEPPAASDQSVNIY